MKKETQPVSSYSSKSFFSKQEDQQEQIHYKNEYSPFSEFSNHDFGECYYHCCCCCSSLRLFFLELLCSSKRISFRLFLFYGCKLRTFGIKRMDCICILDKACMLQYRMRVRKLHNILYFCKRAFSNICVC